MAVEPQYKPLENEGGGGMPCWGKALIGVFVAGVALAALVYFGLVHFVSGIAVAQMVTLDEQASMDSCRDGLDMANMVSNIWWPGCGYVSSLSDFSSGCGGKCFDAKLMEDMQNLSATLPSKKIFYPSRKADGIEDVKLGGWWLPGDHSQLKGPAPRIVLQHGFKSNSNNARTIALAIILRSLGFDVLVNNLRDHCYSDNSTAHIYEWGNAYPMDLLGAWDYAVQDPDGELGGKVDPSQVGLLGYSMGGFITNNAFGLEGKVPAAWVDAPPFVPSSVFRHGLSKTLGGMGLGFMTSIIMPQVWSNTLKTALEKGIDFHRHLPAETLPMGPDTQRPIYTVHNKLDDTVPFEEGQDLLALLKKYPQKYSVKGAFVTDKKCVDVDHCFDHMSYHDEYKLKLCKFWTSVFDVESQSCIDTTPAPAAPVERRLDEQQLHV